MKTPAHCLPHLNWLNLNHFLNLVKKSTLFLTKGYLLCSKNR
ncbi:hypothetical protein PRUB_a2317 [Pseudoalteromonas rubra]|uniref:Uncharacterized protein n=1 Tax=Pseudoalteromonas rubra TaxID=43658 RepID=A0A8T0CAQ4_9GAMM|nr:hypothetical protein PRUB_a2317 [Pseudoalteromonas rubra]